MSRRMTQKEFSKALIEAAEVISRSDPDGLGQEPWNWVDGIVESAVNEHGLDGELVRNQAMYLWCYNEYIRGRISAEKAIMYSQHMSESYRKTLGRVIRNHELYRKSGRNS